VIKSPSALRVDSLSGAVRYYDGFTNDARLTLDTLRSAARSGARVLNYCWFKSAALAASGNATSKIGSAANQPASGADCGQCHWALGRSVPHSRVKLRVTKGILCSFAQSLAGPGYRRDDAGETNSLCHPLGRATILGTPTRTIRRSR